MKDIRAGSVVVEFSIAPFSNSVDVLPTFVSTAFSVAGVNVAGYLTASAVQSVAVQPPPQDCVGSWSDEWEDCSVPCGGGTQSKTYTVTVAQANGGAACPLAGAPTGVTEVVDGDTQSQACNEAACPPPPPPAQLPTADDGSWSTQVIIS